MKNGKLFSPGMKNEKKNENMKNGKLFSPGKKNEKGWKHEEQEIIFTRKEERFFF